MDIVDLDNLKDADTDDLDTLLGLLDECDPENDTKQNLYSIDNVESVSSLNEQNRESEVQNRTLQDKEMQINVSDRIDPLEAELRLMEEKMKLMKEELAKKKKISDKTNFTKFTNVVQETLTATHTRKIIGEEKESLLGSLGNNETLIPLREDVNFTDDGDEIEEKYFEPIESTYSKQSLAQKKSKNNVQNTENVLKRVKEKQSLLLSGKADNCENFFGIKIMNPVMSSNELKDMMEGRRLLKLSTLKLHMRDGDIEGDWVTIGVVVSKSQTKVSQKGTQYMILQLSDLQDCTRCVSLFLFSGAYKKLWKTSVGAVIGILNAQIMKERQDTPSSNLITLSINTHEKVLNIGTAKDLGFCLGKTKQGEPCKQFVNKSICQYCQFHVQREYQKTCAKRSDIQSTFSRVEPKKNLQQKVFGKGQVFYGGQLYSSPSNKKLPVANKSKDLAMLASLKMKLNAEALKEEDKKNFFVLKHMSAQDLSAVNEVNKEKEGLSELLLAPTSGARNLLRHKSDQIDSNKTGSETMNPASAAIKSITPKELLTLTQHQQNKRKRTETSISLPESKRPQIGKGISQGDKVQFNFSPPSKKDLAKYHDGAEKVVILC